MSGRRLFACRLLPLLPLLGGEQSQAENVDLQVQSSGGIFSMIDEDEFSEVAVPDEALVEIEEGQGQDVSGCADCLVGSPPATPSPTAAPTGPRMVADFRAGTPSGSGAVPLATASNVDPSATQTADVVVQGAGKKPTKAASVEAIQGEAGSDSSSSSNTAAPPDADPRLANLLRTGTGPVYVQCHHDACTPSSPADLHSCNTKQCCDIQADTKFCHPMPPADRECPSDHQFRAQKLKNRDGNALDACTCHDKYRPWVEHVGVGGDLDIRHGFIHGETRAQFDYNCYFDDMCRGGYCDKTTPDRPRCKEGDRATPTSTTTCAAQLGTP